MSAESDPTDSLRNNAGSHGAPTEVTEGGFDVDSSVLSRAALRELLGRLHEPSTSGTAASDGAADTEFETSSSESVDNIYSHDFDSRRPDVSQPFLSVILIAGDASNSTLSDALVSLDAQSNSDFELIVVASPSTDLDRVRVEETLSQYSSGLAKRSRVIDGPSPSLSDRWRFDALRAAADETSGRYIAVLDGTSVAFAHFVATFARLAHDFPAAVLRARAISQPMHEVTWPDGRAGFEPTGGAAPASAAHFSVLEHLLVPNTPPGSFALSSPYFHENGFDGDDNETLVEAAILGGVGEAPDDVVVLLRQFDNENVASERRPS